ncbi:hypothetical protein [Pseudomonas sp. TMP25]|uniref:hypothetical protein n=1 Tax=Pseudomonas sp. TMP25 TaxID=3136561 RepID=UPI003101660D
MIRLLFEHADEILKKLEFLNESASKFERLELMINGFDGSPGLIEVVEILSFEIKKFERRGHSSNQYVADMSDRLLRIESMIDGFNKPMEFKQKEHIVARRAELRITVFLWGGLVLGLFNTSILAWSAIG